MTLFKIVKSLQDCARLTLSHALEEKASQHSDVINPCKHAEKVPANSSFLLCLFKISDNCLQKDKSQPFARISFILLWGFILLWDKFGRYDTMQDRKESSGLLRYKTDTLASLKLMMIELHARASAGKASQHSDAPLQDSTDSN
jgi:hypothetical protein